MNKIIICFFILLLQSCNSNESKVKNQNDNIVMPNDIRWVINSNEYDVLSEQIYYNAWDKLKNTLNDEKVKDEKHLQQLINQEPDWSLLEHKEIVEQLFHVHNHYDIISKLNSII